MTSSVLMFATLVNYISPHFNRTIRTKDHDLIGINVFALLKLTGHFEVALSLWQN